MNNLITAVNIPSIHISLRDRTLRTAQQLTNHIANRLSKKPETAKSAYMNNESTPVQTQTVAAKYTFDQKSGGATNRSIKPFGNRGPRGAHSRWHAGQNQGKYKRLDPSWMSGVRYCFVCNHYHLGRHRHSRDEIAVAIKVIEVKALNSAPHYS